MTTALALNREEAFAIIGSHLNAPADPNMAELYTSRRIGAKKAALA